MSKAIYNPDEHMVDILEPPKYLPSARTENIVQAIRRGDWLNVTNIWLYRINPTLEILFQQRESKSPMYPGLLDCTAAGYLEAGEDSRDGALRELEEEIGLSLTRNEVMDFGRHFNASLDHHDRERRRVISKFIACWQGELSDLNINSNEVSAVFWISAKDFLGLEADNKKIEIEGLLSSGKQIKRVVTKEDFVYNVDDYHFRIIERIDYFQRLKNE